MKKKPWTSALLPALMALLLFPAAGASAEETVPAPREIVTLDQVISAARSGAPGLKLAGITADTARSQLTQVQATNGLALGAKAGYFHQGNLPGTAAAASASGSGLNGENIQGGVTLSGPTSVGLTAPATSVGLTAQHTIPDSAASGPASSLNLSASQTVFDGYPGGRAAAAVQQATSTYRAAQVAYDASMKSTLYQVKQAYYALLGDQNTVLIRQAAVGQAEQNLAYYQGLLTAQRATQLDVLQNQVALTQAQLDLRAAQNTVDVDRRNLSLDIGWPLDRDYTVADTSMPDLPSLTMEDALKTAFQNRSELLTLEMNLAAANVNLALQRSQAYPVVSVSATLGAGQDWASSTTSSSFTVGASIELPVLDGGLRGAQVQQAANQVASYKVQQDQQRQSITIAVQNALFGVRDGKDRLDLASQNVKAAQGQYTLQKARYAVGLVTTLDVLTAFSTLTTAQTGLEQARSTYVLSILTLNNVMGL